MKRICEKLRCVGCGVCETVCSFGAVTMRADANGFLYPRVDAGKCKNCGQCFRRCPINNDLTKNRVSKAKYYGGRSSSLAEVRSSTSGGVASVLARTVLRSGGVVFGAAYDPLPIVRHVGIEDESEIARLKGSKYVESDIQMALKGVKSALSANRRVLFVGLPCHVAAVRSFIGNDPENLTTIDLVCHGKPPQKLFSWWISQLETSRGSKITEYHFREKSDCSWNDSRTYLHYCAFADGREVRLTTNENWYGRYFLGSASFRESCYRCQYARLPRVGDITLADFWGVEKDCRFSNMIKDGVSLVSVQSEKGMRLLDEAMQYLDVVDVTSTFALESNGGLLHPSKRTVYRRFVYTYIYCPVTIARICDRFLFGLGSIAKRIMGMVRKEH
mgnify:FL=1